MRRIRLLALGVLLVVGALLVSACGSSGSARHDPASAHVPRGVQAPSGTLSGGASSSAGKASGGALSSGASSSAAPASAPPTGPPPPPVALPRGGRAIIGHYRVVAFYGAAGAPTLGVLGSGSPDVEARSVIARARAFAPYGLPVQPAMELIATVAQPSPGPDHSYSAAVPLATVRAYLAVAHRYKMLLILDLQPGRSTFLRQARALGGVLADPSVSLGLDPEWKVSAPQRPGDGLIGSSGAADINATASYVQALVRARGLPDKLLVVHEFTRSMLPDRAHIVRRPGVEVTFHADGFGTQGSKINVFRGLAFPGHPFGVGFKLFLRHDRGLMSPAAVMRLSPRPDVVTFQ